MSDETNNRTEQWLKAYAARRREQLDDAPPMHEATRQMLLGEVRRTYSPPARATAEESETSAFLRWAVSGLAAMGVGLLALSIFQSQPTDPNNVEKPGSMAKVTLPTAKPKPSGEDMDKNLIAKEAENLKKLEKSEDQKTAKDHGRNLPPNAALADGAGPRGFDVQGGGSQIRTVRPGVASARMAVPYGNVKQNFAQVEKKLGQAGKPESAVLRNMEVAHNNGLITITDKDGSVYTGRVRVVLATAGMPRGMLAASKRDGGGGLKAGQNPPAAGNAGRRPGKPIVTRPPGGASPAGKDKGKPAPTAPLEVPLLPNPSPPHDMVAKSWKITEAMLNKAIAGSNVRATSEAGPENNYRNFQGKSVWYSYTATNSDEVTISTQGSNFDTTLGVFVRKGGLQPAANAKPFFWNDNTSNVPQSKVTLTQCEPGTTYLIAVDGKGGATGSIKLVLRRQPQRVQASVQAQKPLFYFSVNGLNKTTGQPVDFDGIMYQKFQPAANALTTSSGVNTPRKNAVDRQKADAAPGELIIQGRVNLGNRDLPVEAKAIPAIPVKKASKE